MIRIRSLFTALALVGAAATTAHAGGFLTARFGAADGNVTTTHLPATYYNPAGLAMRGGTRVTAEGIFGYRTVSYSRPENAIDNEIATGSTGTGTPEAAASANSGKASLTNMVVAPFVAAASDFGLKNAGFGISLSVPFGGQASWDQNKAYKGNTQYPGAVDGVQRWTVIDGEVKAIYLTGAAAYYLPAAHLSLGLGVNVIQQNIFIIRARTGAGTDDLVSSSGDVIEGRSLIDVSGTTMSLGAGLMWQPTALARVGFSYQSSPGFGETRMSGTLENKFGTANTSTTKIDVTQMLPEIYRLGAAYRVMPNLELRTQLEFQRWSVFERQCILDKSVKGNNCLIKADGTPLIIRNDDSHSGKGILQNLDRNWDDSYSVSGGASWLASPALELNGMLIFDANAVPDRTLDASFPDSNKLLAIVGGRFGLGQNLSLAANWTQAIYFTRTTSVATPAAPPTTVPSTAGKYTQSVGVVSVALEAEF